MDQGFHKDILENLTDGVITVEFNGLIQDFNTAASRMFGLTRQEVIGKTLTEAFIAVEGFDEFSETLLEAVASRSGPERKVVNVQTGDEQRLLTITTSRLTASDDEGAQKAVGIIAVFSDITEIKELREAEIRLAGELKEQHSELQEAYREIEEKRDELTWVLKRVQVTRIAATALVIVLFLGVGVWTWSTSTSGSLPEDTAETELVEDVQAAVVRPREFKSVISLKGQLQPWRLIRVTSPVDGSLESISFNYGQAVTQGEPLVDLDTQELLLKLQESQIEYENAYETIKEFESWESSAEMTAELRSFSKTKMDLDNAESDLKISEFLLGKGLIPASQHEAKERRYQRQLLNYDEAKLSLERTRARGFGQPRKVAQLEFEKAQKTLKQLEEDLQLGSVTAPIAGVILPLGPNEEGLSTGQAVAKGDVLLTIADTERMTAVTLVDETKITKIQVGQPVKVLGDAFPDIALQGTVSHVSPQSQQATTGAPQFIVIVELEPLDETNRASLRVGMSCQVRIVVYHNPQALMVPIEAIDTRGGRFWLHTLDPNSGVAREKEVQIGLTSLDSVEVLSGVSVGDRVVLPEH